MERIEIINESGYSFGSRDNPRRYGFELELSGTYLHGAVHGVLIDGVPTAVFGVNGGATAIHDDSLLRRGNRCYLAVGSHVVCFNAAPFEYLWALQADEATCFGVHYSDEADAFISHGELEVSRFTESGQKVWSASGEDIFTGRFVLHRGHVETVDFNGRVYCFDYLDGRERA